MEDAKDSFYDTKHWVNVVTGPFSAGYGKDGRSPGKQRPTSEHHHKLQAAMWGIVGLNCLAFGAWRCGLSRRLIRDEVCRDKVHLWCWRHLLCSRAHLRSIPHAFYTPVAAMFSHQNFTHLAFNVGAFCVLGNLLLFEQRVFDQASQRRTERANAEEERLRKQKSGGFLEKEVPDFFEEPMANLAARWDRISTKFSTMSTTPTEEFVYFTLGTGTLSTLGHCLSCPGRPVLGLSGALMGMLTLVALVEPEKRMRMLFPIPGLNVSLSQISDVNMLANLTGFLVATRWARFETLLRSPFSCWRSLAQGATNKDSGSPVAWVAHLTGIGLGFAYYQSLHSGLGLWPENPGISTTHSWDYIEQDWQQTHDALHMQFNSGARGRRYC